MRATGAIDTPHASGYCIDPARGVRLAQRKRVKNKKLGPSKKRPPTETFLLLRSELLYDPGAFPDFNGVAVHHVPRLLDCLGVVSAFDILGDAIDMAALAYDINPVN
jgi:hypothetical protein